jgi:hypothetical protein
MKWIEVVKGKGVVAYSGTCPKCGRFAENGKPCPANLPAKSSGVPSTSACPMKVE